MKVRVTVDFYATISDDTDLNDINTGIPTESIEILDWNGRLLGKTDPIYTTVAVEEITDDFNPLSD